MELLELHDRVDRLDEELRVQKIALILVPFVSILLAVPLLAVLFVNHAQLFLVYPSTFVVILGAILAVLTVERRRLKREQYAVRNQLHETEVAP
ncbi:MAG TPA: hypothetical protein VKA63_04805 [Candidatus Krumholzibacteria bacterium]|nr:hypothetical protein [Candidatus Krumholzibacteria bacterium]